MSVIILLILVSFCIALTFLALFIWNISDGQYDDTHGPSVRILFEDEKKNIK